MGRELDKQVAAIVGWQPADGEVPLYSFNIEAAFDILEWIGPQYINLDNGYRNVGGKITGGWTAKVALCATPGTGEATAPTLMEAICRAVVIAHGESPNA